MAGSGLKTLMAAVVLGMAALALPAMAAAPAKPVQAIVIPAAKPGLLPDMSLGNPKAKITVIEYASAACPHCAHWNETVWPQFEAKYVKTGKVRFIFREVLTNPQAYALSAFMVGRCAVNRSQDPTSSAPYFAVLHSFFSGQDVYYKTNRLGFVLNDINIKTGMTEADIQACVGDEKAMAAFYDNMNAHLEADQIESTPTFVVNGKKIEGHELADLDAAIAAAK
ncbi:putative disulfide isomerase [Asticcacaulis biprosthecium C19]|uniref:Putative disulfide isomerase n=1 Tax=Asticcacaulis biprosthecium C19 TaxID=715226 RepID=F4QRP4_9CAUL|nr:DsbA family protein [Asticcacaulis biprosthecium]EGF90170.1 putative disulfide isomerase [Asticcacaulis biprosthecium C19]